MKVRFTKHGGTIGRNH